MSDMDRGAERGLLIEAAGFPAQAAHLEHDTATRRNAELTRPFMLMLGSGQFKFSIDGNQFCVLLGENLQDGVAGFGDSPDAASRDFDRAWTENLKKESA